MDDEAARAPDTSVEQENTPKSTSTSTTTQPPPLPPLPPLPPPLTRPATARSPNPSSPTSRKSTSSSRGWLSNVRRPKTSPGPRASALKRTLLDNDDARRDSALAPSHATARADTDSASSTSLRKTPSLPVIVVQHDSSSMRHSRDMARHAQRPEEGMLREESPSGFTLDTIIPTGDFDDLTAPNQVTFSKRGSMLLGGKRANRLNKQLGLVAETTMEPAKTYTMEPAKTCAMEPAKTCAMEPVTEKEQEETLQENHKDRQEEQAQAQAQAQAQQVSPLTPRSSPRANSRRSLRGRVVSTRVLSTDEMMLSRKVRNMYQHGNEDAADWEPVEEETDSVANSSLTATPHTSTLVVDKHREDANSIMSSRRGSAGVIPREPHEVAGGIEDWSELQGGEVDRYGFILPKKTDSTGDGLDAPDEPRIQRVSTVLKLMSEEPRRRGLRRSVSKAHSSRSLKPENSSPLKRRAKAPASVFSNKTARSTPQKQLRNAANLLPHNRDRRLIDEASDMLKLPPGLAEIEAEAEGGKAAQMMKAKEIEREEKWRKMAKVVQSGADSGGMMFEFDVKDNKVISRTWKGIPDRWRATAWYAFLAASAKKDQSSPTDEELVTSFYELQEESSADDMQIDVDVPRTINRHIMFRRRYRGGQRLLFRVLHAMSLYLPDTGYVQGMAALAATLLCYYEEDRAFVMLVRLWMLRGLERLYETGFSGLLDALDDFEKNWLRSGDVAKKLEDMCITSTAYGTRWYLTLFNYSLPFPAQLRVWDVFMLLGDASYSSIPNSKFSGDLDVLHATSAALIDATREILLDSDFENAMKVLTSWIPIKDENLLMRVAKTEYKLRKKRANAG